MSTTIKITKRDLEELEATVDTLQDPELIKQFKESQEDVKKGQVTSWKEVDKELKNIKY